LIQPTYPAGTNMPDLAEIRKTSRFNQANHFAAQYRKISRHNFLVPGDFLSPVFSLETIG